MSTITCQLFLSVFRFCDIMFISQCDICDIMFISQCDICDIMFISQCDICDIMFISQCDIMFISQCIHLLESHEDDLTEWYFSDQKENLLDWLCVERVLDEDERGKLHPHQL